jgi:hypothetical protein
MVVHFGRNSDCGIPIFRWCFVYFLLLGARSLANLGKILIVRSRPEYAAVYSIASFVIIDGAFLIWLLYGNFIFYSANN